MGSNPPVKSQTQAQDSLTVARWRDRWRIAERSKKKWEKRFQCKRGWEWYEGYQGPDAHISGDPQQDPYVINLIYPTVEVKIPGMYFREPKGIVLPRPSREDDPITMVQERARLREDMLNTYVQNPAFRFKETTDLSLKESFFFFGLVEVGYEADWIENPFAGKPILEGDLPMKDDDDNPILQPQMIPRGEKVYVRRVPADRFLVSIRSEALIENCDWCGYWDWVYADDIKKDPFADPYARTEVKPTGSYDTDYTGKTDLYQDPIVEGYMPSNEPESKAGMVKICKIWDIRQSMKFIIPWDGDYWIKRPAPFTVPIQNIFPALKYHERREGWYPMPPHFNWLSPQAELNDTREMQRLHRKRMTRRFQSQKGSLDQKALDDLETGGDGTVVQTNTPIPAILPIEDAPLDFSTTRNVPQTKEDFMEITAVGSDQRQGASSQTETATEAQIVEGRARIRESFGQELIAKWVEQIFTGILLTIEAHVVLPEWVMRNIDPLSPTAMLEAQRIAETWQEIHAEQLGQLSFDVAVAAESMSPLNEDVQNQQLFTLLQTISQNPILMVMLRASDDMIRRLLQTIGMRNERAVQQFKLMLEVGALAATAGASAQLPADQGLSGQNQAEAAMSLAASRGAMPSAAGASGAALPSPQSGADQLRAQLGVPS